MANEVIMDKYRDEDHGPRVELERLLRPDKKFDEDWAIAIHQIYKLVEEVAPEVKIPRHEVHERVHRMIMHTDHPSIFIVLKVNRVIRGLIIAEVGDTENTSHVGWLRMEVHPDYRNEGYGKMLLDEMIKTARAEGLARLEITSYRPNYKARAFFQKNGFVTEGTHRRARRDPATGEFIDTYTLAAIL